MTRQELFPVMSSLYPSSPANPQRDSEGLAGETPKLRAPLALHYTDSDGKLIEDGPLTTAECCERGIRLF